MRIKVSSSGSYSKEANENVWSAMTYGSFGQETVITYNFFSFDTITELFYFGGSRDDTMQEQKGKGNAFIFGFPVSTGTVYIDRYTEKGSSKALKCSKCSFLFQVAISIIFSI